MITREKALNELTENIDNLICHGLRLYYKRMDRQHSNYFSGMVDAYYQFAYYMIDNYTIQDAIDELQDDVIWYKEYRTGSFYNGYIHAAHTILDCMYRFRRGYEDDCDVPIRHIYSCIGIDSFK